jgi:hypothetical protein
MVDELIVSFVDTATLGGRHVVNASLLYNERFNKAAESQCH